MATAGQRGCPLFLVERDGQPVDYEGALISGLPRPTRTTNCSRPARA
jgi:hypothetical protein